MITPVGEAKLIFSDLYFEDCNLLMEAKGGVDRESIRMAIGQLTDYRRFKPQCRCAILLPAPPRRDLVDLLKFAGVEIHCPVGDGFEVVSTERNRDFTTWPPYESNGYVSYGFSARRAIINSLNNQSLAALANRNPA